MQNSLANSPYLQWAVTVSGTLNVSMQNTQFWLNNPGYTVVNATGTRTIQFGGQTVTNRILGVAPQLSFNWNDNKLNLFAPFLTGIHAVTFVLDGVANFANGPIPELAGFVNSTYVLHRQLDRRDRGRRRLPGGRPAAQRRPDQQHHLGLRPAPVPGHGQLPVPVHRAHHLRGRPLR